MDDPEEPERIVPLGAPADLVRPAGQVDQWHSVRRRHPRAIWALVAVLLFVAGALVRQMFVR